MPVESEHFGDSSNNILILWSCDFKLYLISGEATESRVSKIARADVTFLIG